jgi:hypothetical protein
VDKATDLHIPLSGNNGNRGAGFILKVVELDSEKNLLQEKVGGANQTIFLNIQEMWK